MSTHRPVFKYFIHAEPKIGDTVTVKKTNGEKVTGNITAISQKGTVKLDNYSQYRPIAVSETKSEPLLRQSTDDLNEHCSHFTSGELPELIVTGSKTFVIGDEPYKVTGELGVGKYGVVLEAIDQKGRHVAVKFMFDEDQAAQRRELSMQYWLSCMLKEKPPPTGAALVSEIYSIANYTRGPKRLKGFGDTVKSCTVGVMEIVGSELYDLIKGNSAERVPIVRQVLKDVATTLEHVNALSVRPFFVHGDLHEGNIMYKERENGQLQFYILDFGFGELKQYDRVLKSPNPNFYQKRARRKNGFRNVGSVGNDLCTLCFSIAGKFSPYPNMFEDLPELWNSIYDILELKQAKLKKTKLGRLIDQRFLNTESRFYLGCNDDLEDWPLKNRLLAHLLCYDYGDADSDIAAIFEPTHFLDDYIQADKRTTAAAADESFCIIS